MVYYQYLFKNMEMLSVSEKIVYSALIGYSIRLSEDFYIDGCLDEEYLKQYVNSNSNEAGYGHIPLILPGIREMARELNISRNMLRKCMKRFNDIRLTDTETIVCHKDLFDLGYLTLPNNLGIRGQLLVFYAFLEYRSRPYDGIIDTWASRLEELIGIDKGSIYDMLHKLHKKGLVQRLPGNRLKINTNAPD